MCGCELEFMCVHYVIAVACEALRCQMRWTRVAGGFEPPPVRNLGLFQ